MPGSATAVVAPRICCLDLDTFFVSVERLLDPTLEGKPVVVGGRPGERGVVTACSYEVRAFGVHSGMSLRDAVKLAPHAIYLPTRSNTYGAYSKRVHAIAAEYTPLMRVASIDELYMDFSGCERLYHRAGDADADASILRVTNEITQRVREEIGLPSSAGIGTCKAVAKVACGQAKPAGVLMVRSGEERAFLSPLPVRKLPGIGPVAAGKLNRLGIETLGQVAHTPVDVLRRVFGAWAEHVLRGARGEGSGELGRDRPAFQEHDPDGLAVGSISNERTFREDIGDPAVVESMLCSLCERVCWRARKRGVKARTVTLKLRYSDFETISRSKTLSPTASELEIYPVVHDLYLSARTGERRIRLLGVQLSKLGVFDGQLSLFDEHGQLHETVDDIRKRFGFDAVRLARGRPATRR
jgi:DNA polymerase-4